MCAVAVWRDDWRDWIYKQTEEMKWCRRSWHWQNGIGMGPGPLHIHSIIGRRHRSSLAPARPSEFRIHTHEFMNKPTDATSRRDKLAAVSAALAPTQRIIISFLSTTTTTSQFSQTISSPPLSVRCPVKWNTPSPISITQKWCLCDLGVGLGWWDGSWSESNNTHIT